MFRFDMVKKANNEGAGLSVPLWSTNTEDRFYPADAHMT